MRQPRPSAFACACGAVTGRVRNVAPPSALRLRCYCPDCRAAELYFQQPDPGEDGVDLIQVVPSDVVIETGHARLGVLRLYPNGLMRWYARCCDTPLFNSAATPKVRLLGLMTRRLEDPDAAGRVRARAFVRARGGKRRHKNGIRMLLPMLRNSLSGLLSGAWRDTPLFDANTGKPIARPQVLTEAERRRLGLGPLRFPSA